MGRKTLRQRRDRDLKREQLETFGLDDTMQGMYRGLETAFNAGKTASTEVLEAFQ